MTASDSNMSFRRRLLDLIDRSGVSDRRLSLLATGSADTVRNLRRGSSPRCREATRMVPAALGEDPPGPQRGPGGQKRAPDRPV